MTGTPSRILVIQTGFIGDTVLTTALINEIRNSYPQAEIDIVVRPSLHDFVGKTFNVNKVYSSVKSGGGNETNWNTLIKELRNATYDRAFLPHRSIRSALTAYRAGIPMRTGFSARPELVSSGGTGKWWTFGMSQEWRIAALFYNDKRPWLPFKHEVNRQAALLPSAAGMKPSISVPDSDKKWAEEILKSSNVTPDTGLIAMVPGSIWPTKRWPAENFMELARLLTQSGNAKVLLIGGKDDAVNFAQTNPTQSDVILNMMGDTSLVQAAALLSLCRVCVTNDSGPMHIAAALGIPVVSIFGGTTPDIGFTPYGDEHIVLEGPELPCRPCGPHGACECKLKDTPLLCLKEVSVDKVHSVVLKALDNEAGISE
jgi:lipopolysaccharide heptosyltransferase II